MFGEPKKGVSPQMNNDYIPKVYTIYNKASNARHAKDLLRYLMSTPPSQVDTVGALAELASAVVDIYNELIFRESSPIPFPMKGKDSHDQT